MNVEMEKPEFSRMDAAVDVGVCFRKMRRIMRHERLWIQTQKIPESYQGKTGRVTSMLDDEGTLCAAREYINKTTASEYHIKIFS